jgi:hypothetical protein
VVRPATKGSRFCFWRRESQTRKEVMSEVSLRRNQKGKGPDACFAARQIYKTPSPRKLTFYLTYLWFHRRWVGVVGKGYSVMRKTIRLLLAAVLAIGVMAALAGAAFAQGAPKFHSATSSVNS